MDAPAAYEHLPALEVRGPYPFCHAYHFCCPRIHSDLPLSRSTPYNFSGEARASYYMHDHKKRVSRSQTLTGNKGRWVEWVRACVSRQEGAEEAGALAGVSAPSSPRPARSGTSSFSHISSPASYRFAPSDAEEGRPGDGDASGDEDGDSAKWTSSDADEDVRARYPSSRPCMLGRAPACGACVASYH